MAAENIYRERFLAGTWAFRSEDAQGRAREIMDQIDGAKLGVEDAEVDRVGSERLVTCMRAAVREIYSGTDLDRFLLTRSARYIVGETREAVIGELTRAADSAKEFDDLQRDIRKLLDDDEWKREDARVIGRLNRIEAVIQKYEKNLDQYPECANLLPTLRENWTHIVEKMTYYAISHRLANSPSLKCADPQAEIMQLIIIARIAGVPEKQIMNLFYEREAWLDRFITQTAPAELTRSEKRTWARNWRRSFPGKTEEDEITPDMLKPQLNPRAWMFDSKHKKAPKSASEQS